MHPVNTNISTALQWLRSFVFVVQIYVMMAVMGIVFFPWAIVSRRGARIACKSWCKWVVWSARWMIGLKTEIRGTPPTEEALIAAKHQSFFDIIVLFASLPVPKYIMKRELLWTPVIGLYALRIGCIPVDRGKRSAAIRKMVRNVAEGKQEPGQLVIYPQGTRVAPGKMIPYKVGIAVLYNELRQPCIPVATNIGLFWPRTGIMRKPGTAIIEFLPAIAPGQAKEAFLTHVQDLVETRSNELMREAGFNTTEAQHDTDHHNSRA